MRAIFKSLVLLAAWLMPSVTTACSCLWRSVEERFDEKPIVFIASFDSVEDIRAASHEPQSGRPRIVVGVNYGVRIGFRVLAPLKGDPAQVSALYSGYGGGDCGFGANPRDVVLVGTDASGKISICGLADRFHLRSCRDVHRLDRLRQRGQDGKTPLDWPEDDLEAEPLDQYFVDLMDTVVAQGRNAYELRPEECPL